uniref:Uncharacterized protein n=1 Tax=Mola mola TaxID=94237 RepID=A0A3Q3WZA6_MOLML
MLSGCWITALLLLLLLLAVVRAQSGDGDGDMEPSVSCTSHIMTDESSLTCKLVRGRINYNDDDDEPDGVEKITACYTDLRSVKLNCAKNDGDTISFRDLSPVVILNVTVDFKRGGKIIKMIDLKKIIKPRSPHVLNVTFNHESNKVLIHIRTPYHKEYLKVKNQLFQLLIWSANGNMVTSVGSLQLYNPLRIFSSD